MDDINIYRTANQYIKLYGEDAAIQAAMMADEMLAKADFQAQRVWIRIMRAVDVMQGEKAPHGEWVH